MSGILRGLTENRAETDPTSTDRRLRGRTYAIPFEDVWQAATRLAGSGLKGWQMVSADDQSGVIQATTKSPLLGFEGDARVEIGLDENGQTRVDAAFASRTQRGDLGRSRRAIGHLFNELDVRLDAKPGQILDATCAPAWLEPQS